MESSHREHNPLINIIGGFIAGTVIFLGGGMVRDHYTTVPLEGKVIQEYGKVEDGTYGFKLESNHGREFYITLNPEGKFGKEKVQSVSEAIETGSIVKFLYNSVRERKDDGQGVGPHAEACHPSDIEILVKDGGREQDN